MNKIFFTLFFISVSTLAQNITMTVGQSGALILEGNSCEELKKQETSICQWKKQLDLNFDIATAQKNSRKCVPKKKKQTLTIVDCIPEFAKNYANKHIVHDGPNCWGTALGFKDISYRPRFVWPEEMRYWVEESPICKKLTSNEKTLPGDIINVYGPEYLFKDDMDEADSGVKFWDALYPKRRRAVSSTDINQYSGYHRLLHSETIVSEKIVFGKDSPSKDDKFNFRNIDEVYGRPREVECQENQDLTPHYREYENDPKRIRGTKCAYFTQAFRCGNFYDYFETQKLNSNDKEILERVRSMNGLQDQLHAQIFTKQRKLSECEIQLITASADINAHLALEALKKPNLNKVEEMLYTLEYFTAAGIRKSLEFANLIPEKIN